MPLCERHETAVRITNEVFRRGKNIPRSDRLDYTRAPLWLQSHPRRGGVGEGGEAKTGGRTTTQHARCKSLKKLVFFTLQRVMSTHPQVNTIQLVGDDFLLDCLKAALSILG